MNDTHGVKGEGWIGFDLDGTLAIYNTWEGVDHIGTPVFPMVKLIRELHESGKKVKILTARVSPRTNPEEKPNPYMENHWCIQEPSVQTWAMKDRWTAREFVEEWCYRNIGFVPEITHEKDHLMLELYDDRVKQVVPNKGALVEDMAKSAVKDLEEFRADAGWLLAEHHSRRNSFTTGFWVGFLVTTLLTIGLQVWDYCHKPEVGKSAEELRAACTKYLESVK